MRSRSADGSTRSAQVHMLTPQAHHSRVLNARGVRAGETHAASDFALFEVQMTLSEEGDAHTSEIILGARSRGDNSATLAHSRPLCAQRCSRTFECSRRRRPRGGCSTSAERWARWPSDSARWTSRSTRSGGWRQRLSITPPTRQSHAIPRALARAPCETACGPQVICAGYRFYEFDPDAISAMLGRLTAESVMVVHVSASHKSAATMVEPWYGTRYHVSRADPDVIATWAKPSELDLASELFLPEPNPFIPTDFSLACDGDNDGDVDCDGGWAGDAGGGAGGRVPSRLRDDRTIELWHKMDRTFRRQASVKQRRPGNSSVQVCRLRAQAEDEPVRERDRARRVRFARRGVSHARLRQDGRGRGQRVRVPRGGAPPRGEAASRGM